MMSALVLAAFLVAAAVAQPPSIPDAPPIHAAAPHTQHLRTEHGGSLSSVEVPGGTPFKLVHLHGTTRERGFAYGQLLASDIIELSDAMDGFYRSEVSGIPWSKLGLPPALQHELESALEDAAPAIFEKALGWVFTKQHPHLVTSRVEPLVEIEGIAAGICSTFDTPCNATHWEGKLQKLNMLPELIRMTCSMIGAWGSATPDSSLVQLRSLDFGSGPFVNHTVLAVHHPTGAHGGVPFAAVSFSGLVGVVTGFSEHIGMSEKVWETYRKVDVQPGTYDGMPVVMIIREMLQFSSSKAEAIAIAEHAQRTWAVLLGVGDAGSGRFDALGYREKSLTVYGPGNMTLVTNASDPQAGSAGQGGHAPQIEDTVYIDRHPQPSSDPTLGKLLQQYHGKLTAELIAQVPNVTLDKPRL
jgi:isopenicillin-N N-acyltransferase-like protein